MTAQTLNPTKPVIEMPKRTRNTSSRSAAFWDKFARKYAQSKVADEAGYENSLARTRHFLKPQDQALEIGCGTGTTALLQADYVDHITGTDISSQMVEIANEKVAKERRLNAEFVVSPAETLPFDTGAFDVVMAHNLFHLVDDLEASLASVHRVLARDGIFITKTPCLGEMNFAIRKVLLPVIQFWHRVPVLHKFTSKDLQVSIMRAGFEICHVEFHGTKGKDMRPFIVARKL